MKAGVHIVFTADLAVLSVLCGILLVTFTMVVVSVSTTHSHTHEEIGIPHSNVHT